MSERHEIQTRRSRALDQSPRGISGRRRNRHGAGNHPAEAAPQSHRSPYADTSSGSPSEETSQAVYSPYGEVTPTGTVEVARSPYADLVAPSGPPAAEPARSPYTDELALAAVSEASGATTPIRRRDLRAGASSGRASGDATGAADGETSGDAVDLDAAGSPRSRARQQRADVRRAQRVRNRVAVGVAVAAVGMVAAVTGVLPFSDHITIVSDEHQATPSPTGSSSTPPDLSPTETSSSSSSTSSSPSPSGSPSGSPSPSGSASPSPSGKPGTSTTAPSSSTSRRTVALGGRTVGGWYAGASGVGVSDGKFQDWLGQPVSVAATWADTSDEVQRTLSGLSDYEGWKGALDIAVGGTVLGSGENYADAARGAYDDRWRAAARVLAETRKGATGPTFVRPFHEMNGDWYKNWVVTKENSADYKRAFARMANIYREIMPTVYIVFSPNFGDHTGISIDYWYPGDSAVDVIGVDYYDDGTSDARVSVSAWNSEADDRDSNGNPSGPESWRQFAKQHGKPLSYPEWGLKPEGDGTDHPEWIKAFNTWMNKNANTATWRLGEDIPKAAAGKVIYSCYFNVVHEGNNGFTIYGTGANPESASVFNKLKWGNRAG